MPIVDRVVTVAMNWTNDIELITMPSLNGSLADNQTQIVTGGAVDSLMNILTAVVLVILILTTAIGNVFVIAVILLERHLQSVANYLILSLAVADLLVACLVMPLGAVYQVTGKWLLGPELCDMWTSSDVLCCTASILHLVAIAVDRYWAVTSVDYIHQRTFSRINIMIFLVWIVSGLVSCFPLFGWKDPEWHERIQYQQCLISQDVGYQVFATLSTFYVPLAIILILYWRIFVTAKKRIRRQKQQATTVAFSMGRGAMSTTATTTTTNVSGHSAVAVATSETTCTVMPELVKPSVEQAECSSVAVAVVITDADSQAATAAIQFDHQSDTQAEGSPSHRQQQYVAVRRPLKKRANISAAAITASANNKRRNLSKRERKAAKTLAIITGAFVICWLPFFVIALLMPVCSTCFFDDNMVAFFLWLGYFNSTLNPILYTIFSPDFRNAFQKLLRFRRSGSSVQLQHSRASNSNAHRGGNNNKLLNAGHGNQVNDPERQSIAAPSNYSA